jgi:enoyl-CoA hydratase/carnithine racemase
MEFENIILEREDRVAVMTLNRPKSLNAFNAALLADIEAALEHVESDDSIRALVITGGEKVFAAGADIKEITCLNTPADAHAFIRKSNRCFNRLAGVEMPVIAAISGFAFGGGCELALGCDWRIASETAQFALPEINLGLMPGAGGTQRLPRLIGMGRALERSPAAGSGMNLSRKILATYCQEQLVFNRLPRESASTPCRLGGAEHRSGGHRLFHHPPEHQFLLKSWPRSKSDRRLSPALNCL